MEERSNEVELAVLRRDVEDLTSKVENLTGEVRELLNAWKGAMWLVSIVKTLGLIAGGILSIWAVMKIGK